jgi:beta-N-acetylhexosaminidase
MIKIQAAPGANVLVLKNGKVVFERSYGFLDYKKTSPVQSETIYDLASITKVLATTQAAMFLHSRGELDMNKTLGDYLPELKGTNKSNLVLKDVMAHEAGLKAFIPHYVHTVESGQWKSSYYKSAPESGFSRPVSNDMYARDGLKDSIWNWTVKSELLPKPASGKHKYVYSDLTMYFMQAVIEQIVNQPLDEFLEQNFMLHWDYTRSPSILILNYQLIRLHLLRMMSLFEKDKFRDLCMTPVLRCTAGWLVMRVFLAQQMIWQS